MSVSGCQAADDAGDERAVAGVLAQVGAVELVVALDAVEPWGAGVGAGRRVPAGVDDGDLDGLALLLRRDVVHGRPRLLEAGLLRFDGGAQGAAAWGDVDPVVGGDVTGREVADTAQLGHHFGDREVVAAGGEAVAGEVAGRGLLGSGELAVEEVLGRLDGTLERLDGAGADQDVVGVEEEREVGRCLGVPCDRAVVGLAEVLQLVGGPASLRRP